MAESPLAAAPARAAAADSIVDADDYDAQLEVVRSLKAAGASPTRVKSAAMKLAQLKRETWVPSGTASRKKKRRAAIDAVKEGFDPSEVEKMEAARDAAAVAEYPPRDPPPMDADGFVVSFPPPRVRTAVNTEGAEGGADTAVSTPPSTEELRRMIEAHEGFTGGADRRAYLAAANSPVVNEKSNEKVLEGEGPTDPADYTGRSPHPILHLLRRCDVDAADEAWFGEKGPGADIRAANAASLRAKGEADLAKMLRRCLTAHHPRGV